MCFVLTQQHWLLPNVWLDPPNMKTTKIMCSSVSKSIPPNTIVDYYALLHLTVPFIPPNPIYTYNTGKKNNFQNVCILHYIGHLSFNPDFCAKFLKRCIFNKEKYRNTVCPILQTGSFLSGDGLQTGPFWTKIRALDGRTDGLNSRF